MSLTAHFNKSCLYSVVRSRAGRTMRFGFLPPHGVQLPNGGLYTVFGNILEAINRGDRATDRRHHVAFAAALDRELIEIVQTPATIYMDVANGANKMIQVSSGTLSAVNPCWESSATLPDPDVPA